MKITNIFKREYMFEFHVQFDEDHNPCICGGNSIKWLQLVVIKSASLKKAEKLAWKEIENLFPEYKGFIQYL